MKKSDLKTGMIVEFRNGKRGLMFFGTAIGNYGGISSSNIREDLTSTYADDEDDIIKVYQPNETENYCAEINYWIKNDFKQILEYSELLWERKEEKLICTIDGVEYSESTLRSIIKKVHE